MNEKLELSYADCLRFAAEAGLVNWVTSKKDALERYSTLVATAATRRQSAEIERLSLCLSKANDLAERFEREWYLRGDEIERLNKCLQYEQHRAERIGTHGPGCHQWGPSHYECAMRVFEPLVAALKVAEAALSDIGDAEREPGDDVAWCEQRAAQAIPQARAALALTGGSDGAART